MQRQCLTARPDPALSAKVVREIEMVYEAGACEADDRPPHVRAASGLVGFKQYLAVIQDDANWLALDGVRLTFSDAEYVGSGRVLYSASAEDPASGEIVGSALGVIEPNGEAHWTELADQQGGRFEGKIEGLTLDRGRIDVARFVIYDDDEDVPSCLFEAELGPGFS